MKFDKNGLDKDNKKQKKGNIIDTPTWLKLMYVMRVILINGICFYH